MSLDSRRQRQFLLARGTGMSLCNGNLVLGGFGLRSNQFSPSLSDFHLNFLTCNDAPPFYTRQRSETRRPKQHENALFLQNESFFPILGQLRIQILVLLHDSKASHSASPGCAQVDSGTRLCFQFSNAGDLRPKIFTSELDALNSIDQCNFLLNPATFEHCPNMPMPIDRCCPASDL